MQNKIERFKEIANELSDLYAQKNTAYGDSFGTSFKKYGPISSLTRISDKFNRFENLMLHTNINQGDERIEDTLRDMASYCIMTLIELECVKEQNKTTKSDKQLLNE